MIYDYNIIFENDEYYIYADKFPDINSSFNWETAQKEIIEEFEFVVGPSGKLVDVQEERNNEKYIINKSTVSKKKIYENFEDIEYDASSIVVDEYGNYISYDEWLFDDLDFSFGGGTPYFSPMTQNVNDTLDEYKSLIDKSKNFSVNSILNNSNVFPNVNIKMNLKVNKPIVKSENSVTRKEVKEGTVIRTSK